MDKNQIYIKLVRIVFSASKIVFETKNSYSFLDSEKLSEFILTKIILYIFI